MSFIGFEGLPFDEKYLKKKKKIGDTSFKYVWLFSGNQALKC